MTTPERLLEIDEMVHSTGHRFNPTSHCFESAIGNAAVNEDELQPETFMLLHLPYVSIAELADYMSWQNARMDARHDVGLDIFPREPADA